MQLLTGSLNVRVSLTNQRMVFEGVFEQGHSRISISGLLDRGAARSARDDVGLLRAAFLRSVRHPEQGRPIETESLRMNASDR